MERVEARHARSARSEYAIVLAMVPLKSLSDEKVRSMGCLYCSYSLAGHTRPCRCPECGTMLEAEMHVWPSSCNPLWMLSLLVYAFSIGLLAFALGVAIGGVYLGSILLFAAIVVLCGLGVYQAKSRRIGYVAIATDGLIVRTPGRAMRTHMMPWHEIRVALDRAPEPDVAVRQILQEWRTPADEVALAEMTPLIVASAGGASR